jgi:hypothetical protein
MNRLFLIAAAVVGMAIAFVDSRPHWDDSGITAFSMLIAAAIFAVLTSKHPWLVALAIGIWIPAHAVSRHPSLGSVGMLAVLVFPLAGAYAGAAARRILVK